ncbi:LysM peptidoglycan-binding domain-containing protein [[Clostridium] hylemonae]|uniref:glycosyl hydrolase family 18 protein n=1 Tax=[Clostridium] hylemonae TaxID=89153 RepID=UPI001D063E20|nr:glycosyl hydrolase family 18 protein [[Clostridium] hylemonae]MCB7520828.1 LysM peptidoglycan-binding domain-containing protein [[Clostridium] hylemonae]
MQIHVVTEGENIDGIAAAYGVEVWQLIYDNQLVYPYRLAVGQALLIQTGARTPGRNIYVNGYAYPFVSRWVLQQTLPFLSELSIFSYGFTAEGALIPPLLDERWMIREAARFGTEAVLTLTPLGPDGRFNNRLISAVVHDESASDLLISNLLQVMREKGYRGLDIDFEYILADDRDAFTGFVQKAAEAVRADGRWISVALAPKTSEEQRGLLYEGKDYRALGEAADHVLLMTYEWGYTYGPPMAVAPLPQVRAVVEYAVTAIPDWKISLGIPNYGYDWPLPYERGVTRAETIGNVQAVQRAIEKGAVIRFDETSQSPYYNYVEDGTEHEVWFEDVRSLQEKFGLITEYELRGCGYWQIMQWFRANWLLLRDNFYILK